MRAVRHGDVGQVCGMLLAVPWSVLHVVFAAGRECALGHCPVPQTLDVRGDVISG
ncbi:hypothetical protein PF008_g28099 [Phytophthora fragariae]|uniref:Uncharacterized protein n=1 Tax=Phytophthora fragariae TaxID=53985 RepID=A0A6G0QCF0_9STRA|nr:hypothetical protein PF008_g28099 [Phytophthora fragariae]